MKTNEPRREVIREQKNVNTGGGNYVGGNVTADGGGDVVMGDYKVTYIVQSDDQSAEEIVQNWIVNGEFQRQPFEPETIFISSGAFIMGRDAGEEISPYETPQHPVTLAAGFRMGKFPVTNAEFHYFINNTDQLAPPELGWNGNLVPDGQEDLPVVGVSWYLALAYCKWLSAEAQTGRPYTLPTEAHWERAARGTDGCSFPWGNEWDPERCNIDNTIVTPVTQYAEKGASPEGVVDLIGNVYEWTTSLWGIQRRQPDPRYHYPWQDDQRNTLEANEQIRRVIRGGARMDREQPLYSTLRSSQLPQKGGFPGFHVGFRVAMIGK